MLAKMPKHPPGPDKQDRLQDVTDLPPSYQQLGIRKQYAARWQAEARVPDQHYHAYLADCREVGRRIEKPRPDSGRRKPGNYMAKRAGVGRKKPFGNFFPKGFSTPLETLPETIPEGFVLADCRKNLTEIVPQGLSLEVPSLFQGLTPLAIDVAPLRGGKQHSE